MQTEERNNETKKPVVITGMTTSVRHICKTWIPGEVKFGTEICNKCRRLLKENNIPNSPMDSTILRSLRTFKDTYNITCIDKIHSVYKRMEG